MKLALKFSLIIGVSICVLISVLALFQTRRIAQLQEREIQDDIVILSRALSSAITKLWQIDPQHARDFVKEADERRELAKIRFEVSPSTEQPIQGFHPKASHGVENKHWYVFAKTYFSPDSQTRATLTINRQLPGERKYLIDMIQSQFGITALLTLLALALVFLISWHQIGKPLSTLTRLTQGISRGELDTEFRMKQRDEIGTLATNFSDMIRYLKQTRTQVTQERKARTQALEQLRHADRLTTMGKLASTMAHELGTPLNVVAGRAAMIQQDTRAQSANENAKIIVEQAQRMTAIIQNILGFSRTKSVETPSTVIGDILEQAQVLMDPICEDHSIELKIEGNTELVTKIFPGKILQVLTNLIVNAIDAMKDAGTITLHVSKIQVKSSPKRFVSAGEFLRIDVRDQGAGMTEEAQAKVFDAFFTTKKQGTGLGLSVCHDIVHEHGGWIEVHSKLGQGSVFSVYLPRKDQA